ncbi:MAG: 5'-3' exonuclease H3TH domain-containing protein, partial [candidate division Zixibacteria bacterium]|nr:5'-3' exonuclease H3TH domain-containing protein [candidate division Zixibacteria bacterium]
MTKEGKTLYLVDGSAMFYRAYYAFIRNPLINSKGEDTSATFGFVNSLLKIMNDEDPDYLAVVFDTREPTFRHKMYDEYKSTRAKMPGELAEQLPRIRQAIEVLNIPSFELAGFEADDIIGTMAQDAEKAGFTIWCVTGDKDFYQLVNDNIGIYNPAAGSRPKGRSKAGSALKMGREEVKAKFGVYPELIIDKLALMGDSSDNVPGVIGIGPKTADKLLLQFGSLEAVLTGYKEIKAKGLRERIAANIDSAQLSRDLVTINTNVPIEFEWKDIKCRPVDYERTRALFLELEFTSLLKQLLP